MLNIKKIKSNIKNIIKEEIFINKKKKIIDFTYDEESHELEIEVSTYARDYKSLYVGLVDAKTKEPYSDVTIYLPESYINENQAYIDPINEEIGILDRFKELGIITETHGIRKFNYGQFTLASFDLDKLKEYDSFGMKRFFKDYDIHGENKKLDYNQLVESDMDFKTKSGYYLHFHPSDDGYDFTYYDEDKKLIDGGILETDEFLPLKEVLESIAGLISRPEIDESLKDLTHINGLEQLDETIEENIKI